MKPVSMGITLVESRAIAVVEVLGPTVYESFDITVANELILSICRP